MQCLGYYDVCVSVDADGRLFFELSNPSRNAKIEDLKKIIDQNFKPKRENNARVLLADEWHAERLEFTI